MVCFVVKDGGEEELVFSSDTLLKDTVGGGNFKAIRKRRDGRLHGDAPFQRRLLTGAHRRVDDRTGMGREPVRPRLARGRT